MEVGDGIAADTDLSLSMPLPTSNLQALQEVTPLRRLLTGGKLVYSCVRDVNSPIETSADQP